MPAPTIDLAPLAAAGEGLPTRLSLLKTEAAGKLVDTVSTCRGEGQNFG